MAKQFLPPEPPPMAMPGAMPTGIGQLMAGPSAPAKKSPPKVKKKNPKVKSDSSAFQKFVK